MSLESLGAWEAAAYSKRHCKGGAWAVERCWRCEGLQTSQMEQRGAAAGLLD